MKCNVRIWINKYICFLDYWDASVQEPFYNSNENQYIQSENIFAENDSVTGTNYQQGINE